ncbi:MAG TPA: hypothetical protein VN711_03830, partial [Candidatus Saccharimonadales bacterium]|nr:hypothetical protein [Candidatus Saccharimonadales bacterium]
SGCRSIPTYFRPRRSPNDACLTSPSKKIFRHPEKNYGYPEMILRYQKKVFRYQKKNFRHPEKIYRYSKTEELVREDTIAVNLSIQWLPCKNDTAMHCCMALNFFFHFLSCFFNRLSFCDSGGSLYFMLLR